MVALISFNLFIDPLWISSHKNKFNYLQPGVNERLQKTSLLTYNQKIRNIDALLLGSSRTTYVDPRDFKKNTVFNYACSSLLISEYEKYIDYAKNLNKNINTIVLSLDFWQSGVFAAKVDKPYESLQHKLLFILKNYSLYSTLKISNMVLRQSLRNSIEHRSYNRNFIVESEKQAEEDVIYRAQKRALTYYDKYTYDSIYLKYLREIKEKNIGMNFIVYTTPLSEPFLMKIFSNKKLQKAYYLWIENIATVFDRVFFYTFKNELATRYSEKSMDGDHFYPDILKDIIEHIENNRQDSNNSIILTPKNYKNKIKLIKERNKQLDLKAASL